LTASFAADQPPLAKVPFGADHAKEFQRQWAKHIGKPVVHTNSIGMKMVLIPPGEFVMGVSEKEVFPWLYRNMRKSRNVLDRTHAEHGGLLTEMPGHRVRLTRPFYLGATEVTVAQFRKFADEAGYKTDAERGLVYGKPHEGKQPLRTWRTPLYPDRPPDRQQPSDDDPVMHLDWNDCMAFCAWLSKKEAKEGYEYSLPTSAQWEYACRAGTTTLWYFGDEDGFDRVGHQYEYISWNGKSPRAVGQGKPNPFGLYDMHGNMMEWIADWLHDFYYLESPLNDPTGPANMNEERNQRRMVRGGAFEVGRYWSRSAWYVRIAQGSNQHRHPGFRVAMHVKGVEGVPPAPEPDMQIVGKDLTPADPVAAQAAAVAATRPSELRIKLKDNVSMQFVLVPAGSFLMGSLKGGRYERPVHQVTFSRPFYIGKYEVTQGQWDAVMGEADRLKRWDGSPPKRTELLGPDKPMWGLTWSDAQEFARKLNERIAAHEFRLPTEAEWEYACRAGSKTEFCFGDDPARLKDYAWVCADDAPRPGERRWPDLTVGGRKPNNWGIHDMHGSVWEWCADWWGEDYYSRSPLLDPPGPETGNFKVLRGGSVKSYGRFARSSFRLFAQADLRMQARDYLAGVRLVINLP
jgi:formylglycine-generating enzyme required for sulfatase activity